MHKIVPIVEGEGEKSSVPLLLRKILGEMNRFDIDISPPKIAHGSSNLRKTGGLERLVHFAGIAPECAGILILMDADEDCPTITAQKLTRRLINQGFTQSIAVVLAKYEYEAWFLASLSTIAGKELKGLPGLPLDTQFTGDVESVRGVKEWLSRQFAGSRVYKETFDQAPMTHWIDVVSAYERSRSFRRLYHAVEELVEAIDTGQIIVTPPAGE